MAADIHLRQCWRAGTTLSEWNIHFLTVPSLICTNPAYQTHYSQLLLLSLISQTPSNQVVCWKWCHFECNTGKDGGSGGCNYSRGTWELDDSRCCQANSDSSFWELGLRIWEGALGLCWNALLVSSVMLLTNCWMSCRPGGASLCRVELVPPCACVGSLCVLRLPPTAQRHEP